MRPIRKTVSAVASSDPIPMDLYANPFNATVSVTLSSGAALVYVGEYTTDDIQAAGYDPNAVSSNWEPITGVAGTNASSDGNVAFPVTAIRLDVTGYTSGTATITVIQSGGPDL